jgi:signal transduction histidine kinase
VKNPLAVILQGVTYLSRLGVPHYNDNDVNLVLEKMQDAVTRADRVVKGLLDFSSPSAPEMVSTALNRVVEQALSLVQHELVRAHITVVTELGKDLPPLKLNRNKIEQVFVNLFMNAVQAMPEGGTLTIRTAVQSGSRLGPVVGGRKTGLRRSGETLVVVELEDTGTGIPEDKLDRVFDPFFTTKPVGQGTGLGLPVTRKIIELHGGAMHIRNRQAGGVLVTLTFTAGGDNDDAEATISQNQQAENG